MGLPSGEVLLGGGIGKGWWLVVDDFDGPSKVLAGPFLDRGEAGWAAGERSASATARPVYGIRREDGVLHRRPSPQDWAWLAHLGGQLDRLPDDWDADLAEDDPLATLLVEVAAALSEAGLQMHDCTGAEAHMGGACLAPESALTGIVVTWRQHDRMSVDQVHGPSTDAAVQRVMNSALADVLRVRGFVVEAFGGASGHVVRSLA